MPEFAECLDIEGFAVYRIAVMFDNDDIVRYYSPVGIHDPQKEAFLADLAARFTPTESPHYLNFGVIVSRKEM